MGMDIGWKLKRRLSHKFNSVIENPLVGLWKGCANFEQIFHYVQYDMGIYTLWPTHPYKINYTRPRLQRGGHSLAFVTQEDTS